MTETQLNRDATNGTRSSRGVASAVDRGALLESHALSMYRTILAYTGGRADMAEDAVGEAFARATLRLPEPPHRSTGCASDRSSSRSSERRCDL